jgi:hypothetical protein
MYRVVINDQTGRYRVEKREWLGWNFVRDEAGDYLGFDGIEQARAWINERCRSSQTGPRRWRVVDCCA